MSGLNLKRLSINKNEILKAEIVSYLTLWEKLDPEKQNKADININCKDLDCWQSILKGKKIKFKDKNSSIIKEFDIWDNFLNDWRNWRKKTNSDYLLQILYGSSESLNSGIDKGSPKEDIKVEPENNRWLANAFGSFKRKIIYLEKGEQSINELINDIKNNISRVLIKDKILYEDLKPLRNKLKELLEGLLSDDRFPINDVSLWEQTFLPASMYKALLSEYVLRNNEFAEIPDRQQIRWRILGVQYDKLGLAEKGFKLASIRWYRERVKEIDEEIKKLLEVEYPIGNEVYRDETGIYFVIGENIGKDGSKEEFTELNESLKELEEEIIEIFEKKLEGEAYPTIVLTKASRGLMNLGYLIEKATENFLKKKIIKNSDLCIKSSLKGGAIGICPLCKIRLIYEKDKEKNNSPTICEVCDERIHHKQVEKWIPNIESETIWTTEIKDKNNRISLISLKLELMDWLSGDLLNSLIINKCNWDLVLENLIEDLKTRNGRRKKLKNTILKDFADKSIRNKVNLEDLIKGNLLERSIGDKWEKFIKSNLSNPDIVNFENRIIDWRNLTNDDIQFLATLILQFLLRKNPSPARLRRIWETTQEFFESIKKEVLDNNSLGIPEWRKKRIVFEVDYVDNLKDKIKETGEELEGNGLLFWAQPNKEKTKITIYLISSIEEFLLKYGKNEIKKKIKKQENIDLAQDDIEDNFEIELKKYSEKENKGKGKPLLELTKNNIKEIQKYKPYASIIDLTPIGWQIIIPAEYTPKFIDLVMEKYNKEFKYVYGKLPIHIGIIVQNYKKPLYIGINALRRIRRDIKEKDIDKLYIKKDLGDFEEQFKLKLIDQIKKIDENKYKELLNKKLADALEELKSNSIKDQNNKPIDEYYEVLNNTLNYYSLYWDNPDEKNYNFYIKPEDNWKKWISTLDKFSNNDKVEIIPNTFDFEFMDTNTRRNDIFYDEDKGYKRAFEIKSNRPCEIEKYWGKFKAFRELFKDKTNTAKMHKLVSLFYEKLQVYEKKYNPLIASAIVNILELRKNKEAKRYIQNIFDLDKDKDIQQELKDKLDEEKLFIDMFEFWHTALKEV